jgi:hypothetical protein
LVKFRDHFIERELDSISSDEILSFLTSLNDTCKQLTKHTRYAYLKALFNFIHNNLDAQLQNPCDTPMLKKLFRPDVPQPVFWTQVFLKPPWRLSSGRTTGP